MIIVLHVHLFLLNLLKKLKLLQIFFFLIKITLIFICNINILTYFILILKYLFFFNLLNLLINSFNKKYFQIFYFNIFIFNIFNYNRPNLYFLNINKKIIFKKYFQIFFKYNFLIFKKTKFSNTNFFFLKKKISITKFNLILFYWSFYFKQLANILNLFYYVGFNNLNFHFLTTSNPKLELSLILWLKYKNLLFYKSLNFFKFNLYNLRKYNYILFLKKYFKKINLNLLIILDIEYSTFFFNFISSLKINLINIFSFNINFIKLLNFSNFLITLNYLNFYKNLLISFFFDIYLLAQFNRYNLFFKNFNTLLFKFLYLKLI